MKKYLILCLAITGCAKINPLATTPSPPPTSIVIHRPPAFPAQVYNGPYEIRIYNADQPSAQPLIVKQISMYDRLPCYREPIEPPLVEATTNPTVYEVADPYYLGRYCQWTFPNLAPINPLRLTATFVADCTDEVDWTGTPPTYRCETARSAPSNAIALGNPPPPLQLAGSVATPTQGVLYILPSGSTTGQETPVAGPFVQTMQPAECNKPANTAANATVNPKIWIVNDPANTGRFCEWPFPTTVPVGTGYRAVTTFRGICTTGGVNATCESPRGPINEAPFSIVADVTAPVAPTTTQIK